MKTDKIEKIKKLLAKADKSRNSAENEADVAMKMAMSLMDSEGLSMSDIQSSSMDDEYGELGNTFLNEGEIKQLFNWEKQLLASLAYFFDCVVVTEHPIRNSRKIKPNIIGRESNRITCEMFYNWIRNRTMKEARDLYGSQAAKRNSYCVGVANGIFRKIQQIKPSTERVKSNAWGIVPINEVKNYVNKIYCFGVKNNHIKTSAADSSAYSAGQKTGENTSLNHQFGLKAICA